MSGWAGLMWGAGGGLPGDSGRDPTLRDTQATGEGAPKAHVPHGCSRYMQLGARHPYLLNQLLSQSSVLAHDTLSVHLFLKI